MQSDLPQSAAVQTHVLTTPPAEIAVLETVAMCEPGSVPSSEDRPIAVNSCSVANISATIGLPFADFVGRCFMRGCLMADVFAGWVKAHQPPEKLQSEMTRRYDWHVAGWVRTWLGVGSCTLAAAALVAMFWESSFRSLVPFVFLGVIAYIAVRFGDIAGLVGTICSALVFASILFEPRPSLAISNPVDRNHLIVMIVIGICASELLGRRRTATVYKPWY
jgi:hypothetical protein